MGNVVEVEGFVISGILSKVNLVERSGKIDLIFVQIVGEKNYAVSPDLIYFGDQDYEELSKLRGKVVNLILASGRSGFTVEQVTLKRAVA